MPIQKLHFITAMLCCLGSFVGWAQDYQIGHTTMVFTDNTRNREIPVEIYYPSDVAGNDVAFPAGNTDQFPPLVFGHGFVMTWDAYQNIWETLVPKGFVVAFPKTEGGLLPLHLEYGKDLAFVVDQVKNLGTISSGIFYQRIASASAVLGHSMGGGAAFLAAQLNGSVTALVALAPAETNPSAIAAAASLSIPSLIISAGNDCVTPASTNQLPMYNSLQSSCKTYVSIIGGSHCQMSEFNFLCQFGESTCSPSPEISRETQHQILSDYLVPWLRAQLKAECAAGSLFNNLIETDDRIVFEKTCEQCEALGLTTVQKDNFTIYPNPFSTEIWIQGMDNTAKTFSIYDASARLIWQQKISGSTEIPTESFEAGLYFYTIQQSKTTLQTGKIIKN